MPSDFIILPKQAEFLKNCDEVKFPAYIGGFGSGKSHVLCLQALREIASDRKCFGLIGAPTYRMLGDSTRRKFLELCPPSWIRTFNKSDNKIDFINGAEVIFRSLDSPEALTNLGLSWFALDEIGEVKIETFRMLQGRLREKGGSHRGFGVGNPAGPVHWTYEYFVQKALEHPDTYRLTNATSYENTFVAASYVEEMARSFGTDSLYYKRFVLGQFVAFEGAYWPNFDIRPYSSGGMVCSIKEIDKLLVQGAPRYYGKVVDFGFEHPFVCMWYVHDGETIIFYDEHYQRHASIQDHCKAIQAKEAEHWKLFRFPRPKQAWTDHAAQDRHEIQNCRDPDSGEYIGFNCVPAEKEVMKGILAVQTLIQNRNLYITDRCVKAKLEIPSYRAKPIDKSTKEQPVKEKDDTCDCIRMACVMELKPQVNMKRYYEPEHAPHRDFYGIDPRMLDKPA